MRQIVLPQADSMTDWIPHIAMSHIRKKRYWYCPYKKKLTFFVSCLGPRDFFTTMLRNKCSQKKSSSFVCSCVRKDKEKNTSEVRPSQKEIHCTMERRRGSIRCNIARLGDSTSGLLTFQDDMMYVTNELEKSLSPIRSTKERRNEKLKLQRVQEDDLITMRMSKSQSSGDGLSKPRSATAGRIRPSDTDSFTSSATTRTRSSNKSRSSVRSDGGDAEDSPRSVARTERTNSSGQTRLATEDHSGTSVAPDDTVAMSPTRTRRTISSDKVVDMSAGTSGSNTSQDGTRHRRVSVGRTRPVLRTHRSGSFALRQFQENYQQQRPGTRRHCKTKSQARDGDWNAVTHASPTATESEFKKPALRLHRSMDGSFSVRTAASKDSQPRKPSSSSSTQEDICYVPPAPLQSSATIGTNDSTSEDTSNGEYWDGTTWDRPMIEVAPGYSLPLCGTLETMQALHLDRIIHVECNSCNVFLACINTAGMVLCPGCRTVSPVESTSQHISPTLGLGLRVEDILSQIGK
jgi:hypothetical protein